MQLDQIIDSIYFLPEEARMRFKSLVKERSYPKGKILLHKGKTETNIYLIRKGMVRAFSSFEDKEVTFWFGKEGDPVLSMKSYVENKIGYEDIELLENGEFFELNYRQLQKLYDHDIHIANWGRKLVERELVKTEEKLISRLCNPAAERYRELLENNADLLRRVPLSHIASFLGITQVSLSRIRAEFR